MYDCPDCSVGFLLETGLKIHISTVHGNICPICGRILKTAAVLKDYISNMHEVNFGRLQLNPSLF